MGAILLTVTRAILAETSNRTNLIVMSAIYGYVRAATVVNQNLTISEFAAQDKLASSLSLTMIMKGVFVITIGQLLGKYFERIFIESENRCFTFYPYKSIHTGWIRDYTGSYSICLHAQNVLLLIVIIIWLPEIIYRKLKRTKKRPQHPVAI